MKQTKILFVAAECANFAATGGLAEVAGSLPQAIMASNKSYKVKVVMPLYKTIMEKYEGKLKYVGCGNINLAWRELYVGVFTLKLNNIEYYFVDNKYYFDRDGLYGHYDDGERFAFFSKSIFKVLDIIKFYPDIIHANDWHTALVNIYLDILYKKQGVYMNIASVFTIHNIEYQGVFDNSFYHDIIGLDPIYLDLLEYNGLVNLIKGAIVCSDLVTTVSPRYSREITTTSYAYGLEHIIRLNKNKVMGIINGIDTLSYDPETDKSIYENYSLQNIEKKVINKLKFQEEMGLEVNESIPMIAIISRLAIHKGINLIVEAMKGFLDLGAQVVVLGTGLEEYQNAFLSYQAQRPNQVKAMITFNGVLARKLYAASDIFLMPSKSEPCGLSQMIASRYGSIPVVRATGGLADTIIDISNENGNGFVFKDFNSSALYEKTKEAINLYRNKAEFKKIIEKAMIKDFSWNVSAEEYIRTYKQLLERK